MSNATCVTSAICLLRIALWSRSKSLPVLGRRGRSQVRLRQQTLRDSYQVLNTHVLAPNACPSSRVRPDVEMKKSAVVNSDAAIEEGRHLQCKLIYLLQRQPGNRDIRSHALCVLTVFDPTNLLIMEGAAIAVMNDNRLAYEGTKLFESFDKSRFDL
jgi:hypothetical protein